MEDIVTVEVLCTGLARLTLNRPERRNALCIAMLEQLCDHIDRLSAKNTARVIILSGAGPVFSAGLDLLEAADDTRVQHIAQALHRTLQLLRGTTLVTIAAAHGGAYAGGAGLMAACDIAVGTSDLKIGFPEARRGLLPALICAVLSPKVREGDLRDLFLVGKAIDAERARQIGLLQYVVEPDKLMEQAIEIAHGVLAGGPRTIVDTKTLLNQAYLPTEATSSQQMLDVHLSARHRPEASEGLAAFLEKRPTRWMTAE